MPHRQPSCSHGDEDEAVGSRLEDGCDAIKHTAHHLRLDAEEDVLSLGGGIRIRAHAAAKLRSERFRLGGGAVGEEDVGRFELLRGGPIPG